MSSLQDSLKVKSAGQKAPSVTGSQPISTPDTPLDEGKSGGIAKSKQVKNAGSTPTTTPNVGSKFLKGIGGSTNSDKTVGYF